MTSRFAGAAPPIKIAVVGLGWAGRSIWLPRLLDHPEFEVVALVDPEPVSRASVGAAGGGAALLSDVSEIDPAAVDLAVVAVPNHLHSKIACRLLRGGISVFLEKPVCLNLDEASDLAAAESATDAVLLAGSAARHRADVRALGEVIGTLGRIRHVDLAWVRARGVPDLGGWFTSQKLSGGGALVDLGWHLLDTITPLLGPVSFHQIVGTVSDDFISDGSRQAAWRYDEQGAGQPRGGRPGNVEDTARGFLIADDGLSVSLRASWASHEARDVTLVRFEGSAGTATLRCTFGFSPNRVSGSTLVREFDGEPTVIELPDEPVGEEYRHQLDDVPALLADSASKGRAIREARQTIHAIQQIYDSAHRAITGQPVAG
ncbi:oxidoreductase [Herbihabitans rhizosphaerae]|uniref:Oxidoreductase n=1 Tax=Herbihabitans rhizosphaerae TaxID=1872711 RepID=A0A4Q7KD97_9PSEU|nr:Gfo/Idh/MocA family oxidoreductase [Herbihabitans rhizosphaerae]RZS32165.1 oxidoreductase [Herbihabitans rhizosphaerae]